MYLRDELQTFWTVFVSERAIVRTQGTIPVIVILRRDKIQKIHLHVLWMYSTTYTCTCTMYMYMYLHRYIIYNVLYMYSAKLSDMYMYMHCTTCIFTMNVQNNFFNCLHKNKAQ